MPPDEHILSDRIYAGKQLRYIRNRAEPKKKKQAQFGRRLGICANTISNYENGRRAIPSDVAFAVKREFGFDLNTNVSSSRSVRGSFRQEIITPSLIYLPLPSDGLAVRSSHSLKFLETDNSNALVETPRVVEQVERLPMKPMNSDFETETARASLRDRCFYVATAYLAISQASVNFDFSFGFDASKIDYLLLLAAAVIFSTGGFIVKDLLKGSYKPA